MDRKIQVFLDFITKKKVEKKTNSFLSQLLHPQGFYMESENDDFQKQSPFPGVDFQIEMLNFRGVNTELALKKGSKMGFPSKSRKMCSLP